MKHLSVLFLVASFTFPTFASYTPGSKCGLTDATSEDWEQSKSVDLSNANSTEINALPTLTKQQLIIAARYRATRFSETEIRNTVQAVEYLRHNSDAHTLSVDHFAYRGERYTQVLHFPGDNPYGVIFKRETAHVVAYNSDDSISCKVTQ